MYKILLVEDDLVIADALRTHLQKWDYQVALAEDFRRIVPTFLTEKPHLVLLDLSLPFYNGFHWCAEIRKLSEIPIVFLSSAADNMNIVMAMSVGADDFIAKPFDLTVLTAKIQAILRRAYALHGEKALLVRNGVIFDPGSGTVSYQEKQIALTRNEQGILNLLLERAGAVVAREDIMLRLWQSDAFIDDNTLTVNVTRLRNKLKKIGLPDWIHTQKGVGYRID